MISTRTVLAAGMLLIAACSAPGAEDAHDHEEEGHEKGHEEKGHEEKGHEEKGHEEKGHEDHDEKGHEEKGHEEKGHEDHEEGVVRLDPTSATAAGIATEVVEMRALLPELQTTGLVDFDQNHLAHVGPRTDGRIADVRADLGTKLKAGDVVAVLDSVELGRARADYLTARATRGVADATLAREEALTAEKISSVAEVLAARAAQQEAQARESAAAETLRVLGLSAKEIASLEFGAEAPGRLPLRAPFDGTLVERHLQRGEFVTPEATLFTVADLTSLWVWVDVYERDLARVHLGDGATVTAAAWPDRTWTGTVTYLRDAVDADTRTVRARIEIDNLDGALRPQMFVTVRLTDPHHRDAAAATEVLAVPTSSVQRREGSTVVYVEEEPGHFEERRVELGHVSAGFAEVLAGVSRGERVVISGAFVLKTEASRESLGGGHSH